MALILFAFLLGALMVGIPISFAMGGVGVLAGLLFVGPSFLSVVPFRVWGYMSNFVIIAAPLFILMAAVLERSGMVDEIFKAIEYWVGFLPGGLLIGTVLIATILAAMSGVAAAATVTLGIIALPAMMTRGYDKSLSTGCIAAGGCLGLIIPPSLNYIAVGMLSGESVGKLFMAGVIPGFIASCLFMIYIAVRVKLRPSLAPALSGEMPTLRNRLIHLIGVVPSIFLVVAVLGSIFGGIASPTEAAAVGCAFTIIISLARRSLSWQGIKEALYVTLRLTGMLMWIIFGAAVFGALTVSIGATRLVQGFLLELPGGPMGRLLIIQGIVFLLGCFMDPWAILMIVLPLITPVARDMGFDMLWFLFLFSTNLTIGLLTPPFGYNLFYMRSVVTEDMNISIEQIYKGSLPFVALQVVVLCLVIIFPPLCTWLPSLMIRRG